MLSLWGNAVWLTSCALFHGYLSFPFPSHYLCYCFPIFHPQQPPSSQPSLWKWEVTLILTPVANGTNTVDALLFLSHDVEYPKLDICPTLEVDVNPSLGCDGYLNLNSNQNEPLSDAGHSREGHLRYVQCWSPATYWSHWCPVLAGLEFW